MAHYANQNEFAAFVGLAIQAATNDGNPGRLEVARLAEHTLKTSKPDDTSAVLFARFARLSRELIEGHAAVQQQLSLYLLDRAARSTWAT